MKLSPGKIAGLNAVSDSHGVIAALAMDQRGLLRNMLARELGVKEPPAEMVSEFKKLVAAGHIRPDENVIAVLTGHMLKDPDYVSAYHRGTLALDSGAKDGSGAPQPIHGAFQNSPERVAANRPAILAALERRR